jgi:hypothetical protein
MKRLILIFLWLPLLVSAQINDDFSDGDFTQDPEWIGNTEKFKVNSNFQLQLNDTAAGLSYLVSANSITSECEWRFWVKQSFSPSGNNNSRVYLISNQQNLFAPLQGYFLQLGEAGSSDAIELFRQDGETTVSVCRGTEGLVAGSFSMTIKVTRDNSGLWEIFIDREGNGIFLPEAFGTDNIWQNTGWFGFWTKYTKSNASKFYWDDVYVGEPFIDTDPPVLEFTEATSDSTLLLRFNEPLDENSATLKTNYEVDHGFQNPTGVTLNGVEVLLKFDQKFQNGTDYNLSVSNIKDLAGNVMEPYQTTFSWYQAHRFNVVFNEIYPDPSPSLGLPKYEFIELYNRTDKAISLDGWKLIIGSSEKDFYNISIKPNGYLILGKEEAANDFANFGDFYGFSSFSLTNSGQTLILNNNNNETINRITYSKDWYHDPDKNEGGWTIEQINPDNVCSEIDNWRASESSYGGTPGEKNSVFEEITLYPAIDRFELIGSDVLRIWFNQAMDATSLEEVNFYIVDNNIGSPSAVFTNEAEPRKAELYFNTSFTTGLLYTLQISIEINNCMGLHPIEELKLSFGIPENIEPMDVVINEILFNPLGDGVDYVELYNRSEKAIDLSLCKIGSVHISPPNPPDTSCYSITKEQLLFVPGGYMVLTKSPEIVIDQYHSPNPAAFIRVNPFPSFNNDLGTILLTTIDDLLIDNFSYSEEMQYPLLNYVDGVALERINPDNPTNDNNNWHSAAESVGFGTPGYQNSQWMNPVITEDEITIEPEVFSPDNDGHEDVININYHFDKPGYNMKIMVYDQNGRLVRNLIDNELSGASGSISWDGITNDNSKAQVGIYIFYIQVFDTDGNVKSWKKTGVLATRF